MSLDELQQRVARIQEEVSQQTRTATVTFSIFGVERVGGQNQIPSSGTMVDICMA